MSLSEQSHATGQALLTLESQRQTVFGYFCAESHRSTFSSIAIRRKYYRPRLNGTGIRIKSDVHSSEDYDLSAQSESGTDDDTDDVTQILLLCFCAS